MKALIDVWVCGIDTGVEEGFRFGCWGDLIGHFSPEIFCAFPSSRLNFGKQAIKCNG